MHTISPLSAKYEARFWAKVHKGDGCWLWTAATQRDGYGVFRDGAKQVAAHRVSYALTYGSIPQGQFVLHRCDTPGCVRPDHLFLGNHRENMVDMVAKGRAAKGAGNAAYLHPDRVPRGIYHGNAKLNDRAVKDIRARHAQGEPRTNLALEYGVTPQTITLVVQNKVWRHVTLS